MKERAKRIACTLALIALVPLASGCFGSFGLVKKAYQFNQDVNEDKWAREGIFILISPVYGFCAALDAVFFNAVEFWTGDQLITDSSDATEPLEVADATGEAAPQN